MNYRILAFALAFAGLAAPAVAAEVLIYHDIQTDASGRIIPWAGPPAKAYDHIVRLVWNFWIKMRQCPNGVPYYMQHQVWKPDQDDKRGLGGDQINMALSSWTLLYGYLGDPAVRQNMIYMADYWLDHGMSKPSDVWANLPYPYNTELHSGQYDGDMMVGKGYLQPDKAASFGAELVVLWKMTQNQRYLDAAVKIANTLVRHVKPGDNDNSPWPYRVHAVTGEVRQVKSDDGGVYLASYTTNWTGALRLFEDLAALGKGDVALPPHATDSRRLAQDLSAEDQQVGALLRGRRTLVGHGNQCRHPRLVHPRASGVGSQLARASERHPRLELQDVRQPGVGEVRRRRHQRADGIQGARQQPHLAIRLS